MKDMTELDRFIDGNLAKKLEEVSRRREKIRPHYGRFTKRVLLIGPVVIIMEALYWNLIAGWQGILFTPMIVVAFLVFGLIFKGVRFGYAVSAFQQEFLEKIGTPVANFLLPEFTYTPSYQTTWDMFSDSRIFEKSGSTSGLSHFSGKLGGVPVQFFYLEATFSKRYWSSTEVEERAKSRGLFFIANIDHGQTGHVIVRRRPSKSNVMQEAKKLGTLVTIGSRSRIALFSELYDIATEEKTLSEEVLPAAVIEGMNEFAEQFTFPVTFALSPGKFYYFLECESFFCLDKAEVNTDTSFSTILHRHLQDLQLAVDSFAVLKLQELASGNVRKRGAHPEVG